MSFFPCISPSLLLSPCPYVCSLCLFLHCCPGSKFFSTIFLDSIYMHQNMIFIFLFLTYFTLYNRFQVHPFHYTDSDHSFLWLSNIPLCICTTTSLSIHLSMDIQVASTSSCCKQCCNEQWDTCVFFLIFISNFIDLSLLPFFLDESG